MVSIPTAEVVAGIVPAMHLPAALTILRGMAASGRPSIIIRPGYVGAADALCSAGILEADPTRPGHAAYRLTDPATKPFLGGAL